MFRMRVITRSGARNTLLWEPPNVLDGDLEALATVMARIQHGDGVLPMGGVLLEGDAILESDLHVYLLIYELFRPYGEIQYDGPGFDLPELPEGAIA